jgi:hypothetical protein
MTKKLLLMVSTTILVCTVGWSATRPLPVPETSREKLQVLKVFSPHDGDAVCREYMVKWKDQDVVVRDPLVLTNYQVGDTINVLVIKNKYPAQPGPDLLSFQVLPH